MSVLFLVLGAAAAYDHSGIIAAAPDKAAKTLNCASQFDTPQVPGKRMLLADRLSGRIVENRSALMVANPVLRTDEAPGPKGENVCNRPVAIALPAINPQGGLASPSPLLAIHLTSGFGMRVHPILGGMRMHSGVDLAAPAGSPIFATYSGKVTSAGWAGGYGLSAAVESDSGVQTRFGHMSRVIVSRGQSVRKGDLIGYVGSSGLSTGPHLHYEVRLKGQAVDPVPLLKERSIRRHQG
jgi:murein DD-endopeptidase MepM/ murein hydrolase activator NlpD